MKYIRHFLEEVIGDTPPGVSNVLGSRPWTVKLNRDVIDPSINPSVNIGDRYIVTSGVSATSFEMFGLDVVNADTTRADIDIHFDFSAATFTLVDSGYYLALGARCSGTDVLANGYFLEYGPASGLRIIYANAGVITSLGTAAAVGSTNVKLRFRVNGTSLKAKAWDSTTTEPAAWNISVTHGSIAGPGLVCVGTHKASAFDVLSDVGPFFFASFGTGGDVAPDAPKSWAEYLTFLNQQDTMRCVLVEVDLLGQDSVGTGTPARVCMSNFPFVSRTEDRYPNIPYEEILKEASDFTRRMDESLRGRSSISRGDVSFLNEVVSDDPSLYIEGAKRGKLDVWTTWNWDGRELRQLYGHPTWRRCDFKTIQFCTVQDIYIASQGRLGFKVRGKDEIFTKPVQTTQIGGTTNSGALRPTGYGEFYNIEPPWYDTTTLELQVFDPDSDGNLFADHPFHTLRDGGRSLRKDTRTISAVAGNVITLDGTHNLVVGSTWVGLGSLPAPLVSLTKYYVQSVPAGNQVTLSATSGGAVITLTTTTTGAQVYGRLYDWSDATGRVKLHSNPEGRITFDSDLLFAGGETRCAHDLILWLMEKSGLSAEVDTSTVSSDATADLVALGATADAPMGIWMKEQRSRGEVLDEIVTSIGGFTSYGRTGLLRFGVLMLPTGTPQWTLLEDDVIDFKPATRRLPALSERLGWRKNYTVQKDGLLTSVSAADRALFALDYLYVAYFDPSSDLDNPDNHLLARPEVFRGTLIGEAGPASAEVERIYNLYKKATGTFTFRVDASGFTMELGDTLNLTHSRFGFTDGKDCVIVGLIDRPMRGQVEVEIFCQIDGAWPVVTASNPFVSEASYQ